MTRGRSQKCCCGVCGCRSGTSIGALQGTPSGISQVNTPPLNPTPPCPCAGYNVAIPLGPEVGSFGPPPGATDVKPGAQVCYFSGSQICEEGLLSVAARVAIYPNDSGGVSAWGYVDITESGFPTPGSNVATYNGMTVVVEEGEMDCGELDFTIPLTFVSNVGTAGGPVWCGTTGTISLRVETAA